MNASPKWKRSMNRKIETNDTNEMFCYLEPNAMYQIELAKI